MGFRALPIYRVFVHIKLVRQLYAMLSLCRAVPNYIGNIYTIFGLIINV